MADLAVLGGFQLYDSVQPRGAPQDPVPSPSTACTGSRMSPDPAVELVAFAGPPPAGWAGRQREDRLHKPTAPPPPFRGPWRGRKRGRGWDNGLGADSNSQFLVASSPGLGWSGSGREGERSPQLSAGFGSRSCWGRSEPLPTAPAAMAKVEWLLAPWHRGGNAGSMGRGGQRDTILPRSGQ